MVTGLETQQEQLDKEADTATAPDEVRWCGERDAHGAHQWPELVAGQLLTHHCYGTSAAGAKRMRFERRQFLARVGSLSYPSDSDLWRDAEHDSGEDLWRYDE